MFGGAPVEVRRIAIVTKASRLDERLEPGGFKNGGHGVPTRRMDHPLLQSRPAPIDDAPLFLKPVEGYPSVPARIVHTRENEAVGNVPDLLVSIPLGAQGFRLVFFGEGHRQINAHGVPPESDRQRNAHSIGISHRHFNVERCLPLSDAKAAPAHERRFPVKRPTFAFTEFDYSTKPSSSNRMAMATGETLKADAKDGNPPPL